MEILRILLPLFLICILAVYLINSSKKKARYKSNKDKQKNENYMS